MKGYRLELKNYTNWPELPTAKEWDTMRPITDFSYPWRSEKPTPTVFKACLSLSHFYFHYEVEDPAIRTKIASWPERPVIDSDRVEIFFRKDATMSPYFCLEIDARGRVLDYVADFHRQFDYDWEWPEGQLAVSGALTEKGYEVTAGVSIPSLQQLGVWQDNRLEVGLYRAEYLFDAAGTQKDVKWISWCTPDSAHPDFHIPSSFGELVW